MKTMNEVLQDVRQIVAETLALDLEEVTPTARFFEDLGGESLDLLDASFKCDKHFGIRTELQKIFSPDDLQTDANGVLTPESLANMRGKYGFLDWHAIEADPRVQRVREVLTVQAITNYVYETLLAKEKDVSRETVAGFSPA